MDETYSVDPAVFDLAESQVFHQMVFLFFFFFSSLFVYIHDFM